MSLEYITENLKTITPFVFSEKNFNGVSFPNTTSAFTKNTTYLVAALNLPSTNLQSFYVPYGTKLIISGTNELIGSLSSSDCTSAYPYTQGITSLRWEELSTFVDEKAQCNGYQMYFGNSAVKLYQGQSKECDEFFKTYCESNPTDVSNCSCFQDETKLKLTFPDQSLPVTCLGKNCVKYNSYQTNQMKSEICTVKLCSSETFLHGSQLYASSNNEIVCGDSAYYRSFLNTPTPTPVTNGTEDNVHIELWLYILLISFIVIISCFIGLILRYTKTNQ